MYERLRARELDPRGRLGARAAWGGKAPTSSVSRAHDESLRSWAESDALRHCTATYSELRPAPRSTIAAAYSPDGTLLASTHGDHTVKLIDCRTGRCVRVLTGHRRTPWVVRFHPADSNVLVSGSLDHQVRVWNATSAECILCFDFGKPIASLAFNADGTVLAVASGHKLYAWRYRNMAQWDERRASRDPEARAAAAREAAAAVTAHEDAVAAHLANSGAPENHPPPLPPFIATFPSRGRGSTFAGDVSSGETSAPCIALRTRRSLRAVHFHPHGAPLLLSAEVNETSEHDVPPLRALTNPNPKGEWETAYAAASAAATAAVGAGATAAAAATAAARDAMDTEDPTASGRPDAVGSKMREDASTNEQTKKHATSYVYVAPRRDATSTPSGPDAFERAGDAFGRLNVKARTSMPSGDHADFQTDVQTDTSYARASEARQRRAAETAAAAAVGDVVRERRARRGADSRRRRRATRGRDGSAAAAAGTGATDADAAAAAAVVYHSAWSIGGIRVVGPDGRPTREAASVDAATAAAAAATSAAAAAGAEQPCTVKLRVWAHDASDPLRPLRDARLQIPHAVLCSEMGAHFSPRGRKLAVCAACVPKGAPNPMPGAPIPDLVYELRVYSLEPGRSFGEVLSARAIRAAHCLTSVQFSPDGEHVLVAYGRRHASLLLLVADGGRCVAVHTVLETYRARDMALVRSLASAEDEVNVACFHPEPGGGVAYGTKEGKLRVLRHDKPPVLEPDEGGAPAGAEPETRPTAVGRCLQDELRETLEWSEDEGSGHDDGSEDGSGDGEESGEETDNRLSRE